MEHNSYRVMANAVRLLSVDAIQSAASGHPGMPLGMADVATVLFAKFLRFSVDHPSWFDRDRLVLSNGHGSMLMYSIMHLLGYISIDDIKNFRQLHSVTPGHPEYGCTVGVDVTTGPLGQGLGCSVGLAIAERMFSQRFGADFINHYTYAMVGDGCLMEGISHEAASLAGHLGLDHLIVLFDDNGISIDGSTSLSTSDDIRARFSSYGWGVWEVDGHDFGEIECAIKAARESEGKPSIICCKTVIGKFMPSKENTSAAHSWPFSPEDAQAFRDAIGWKGERFEVSEEARVLWGEVRLKAEREYSLWIEKFADCEGYKTLNEMLSDDIPNGVMDALDALKSSFCEMRPSEATRKSFGRILELLVARMQKLVGGSSDLTSSNNTKVSSMKVISAANFNASYVHYGVREHAMAACMNGMALHGGVIPYGGTFLVFSDYCRPAIRLSALMGVQVIYVMTHDSIGVGEDGPTHQPIEHLASLRAIPNLYVFRPADAVEVLECWEIALGLTKSPSLFALSRQSVNFNRASYSRENLSSRGAYIVREHDGSLDVTIFATGSEVDVALGAREILQGRGVGVRVISMPCWRIFDEQDSGYILSLLDNKSLKVAVEAACSLGWHKYLGEGGIFIGLDRFGASGKCEDLYRYFGVTKENVADTVLARLHYEV
ncbi:transketolase [Anaplasma capra]|uniref:transketolase n=1 Tax=Anaplasma capra TaxID=1562740 RepID=UPI0021D61031|nr:transketolase [Anaplasma capra]MCU7611516.1 transketolase [Anaplasma capra]MCU7612045.1 transketolase [Anaplasma capra]